MKTNFKLHQKEKLYSDIQKFWQYVKYNTYEKDFEWLLQHLIGPSVNSSYLRTPDNSETKNDAPSKA